MWPLGHAAAGYLVYSLGVDRDWLAAPSAGAVVALAVGTQVPDLIDKPLAWIVPVLPAGRSLGHSLLFVVPACVAAVLVARALDRSAVGIALALGILSHPLVDVVPFLWGNSPHEFLLWPVLTVEGYDTPPSVLAMLREDLTDPWFHLEFVLAAAALVRWHRDGTPGLPWIGSATDA